MGNDIEAPVVVHMENNPRALIYEKGVVVQYRLSGGEVQMANGSEYFLERKAGNCGHCTNPVPAPRLESLGVWIGNLLKGKLGLWEVELTKEKPATLNTKSFAPPLLMHNQYIIIGLKNGLE